jgi:hypothetical protein
MTDDSTVIPPDQQAQISDTLETDAQVMSNSQLEPLLADEPEDIRVEILRINADARNISLQVALLVPVLAGLAGLVNSFRMLRLPEIVPSAPLDGMDFG